MVIELNLIEFSILVYFLYFLIIINFIDELSFFIFVCKVCFEIKFFEILIDTHMNLGIHKVVISYIYK